MNKAIVSLVMVALFAFAHASHAKYVDHAPDLTSPEFWDGASIYLARVNDVSFDKSFIYESSVIKTISGPTATNKVFVHSNVWFWNDRPDRRVQTGDYLLAFEANKRKGGFMVIREVESPASDPLVKSVTTIADLRSSGDVDAVWNYVGSQDELVSMYCLKEILSRTGRSANANYLAELQTLRNDGNRGGELRLLASNALLKLSGQPDATNAEYDWLRQAISTSRGEDPGKLAPLVTRMLEFSDKRANTMGFLTGIILDQNASKAARIATASAFQNNRVLNYDKPDEESEKVFAACLAMLKDNSPEIRFAGARIVLTMAGRFNPNVCSNFETRARQAIQAIIATDPGVKLQLLNLLRDYDNVHRLMEEDDNK